MGTTYKGNTKYYRSIGQNVLIASESYPFNNGRFGVSSPSTGKLTRNIFSADPVSTAKDFYDKTPYKNLAVCISSPDVAHTKDKTIHKAKGDEYDNVMVILDDDARSMDFLLNPE